MTNFNYTRNIPNPPNNPSQDVPNMQINTNSVDDLINVDHFSFLQSNGGSHRHVQLSEVAGAAPPAGLIGLGFETLYSQVVSGSGELFFTRGASGVGIQLTSSAITPATIIPTFTAAVTSSATFLTFLPGNAVLISGFIIGANATQQVTFGFNIPAIFSVQITRLATEGSPPSNRSFHQVTALGASPGSFTFRNLDEGGSATAGFNVMWQLFGVL